MRWDRLALSMCPRSPRSLWPLHKELSMNRQLFMRRIEDATQGGVKSANSLGGRGAGKGPTLLTGQDGSIDRHV